MRTSESVFVGDLNVIQLFVIWWLPIFADSCIAAFITSSETSGRASSFNLVANPDKPEPYRFEKLNRHSFF